MDRKLGYFLPPEVKITANVSGVKAEKVRIDEGKLLFQFISGYLNTPVSNSYSLAQASTVLRNFVATYTGRAPKVNLISLVHLREVFAWNIYKPYTISTTPKLYGPSVLEYFKGYVPAEKLLEASGVKPPEQITKRFENYCKNQVGEILEGLEPLGSRVASKGNSPRRRIKYLVVRPKDSRIPHPGPTDHPLKDIATGEPGGVIIDQAALHREWAHWITTEPTGVEELNKAILYRIISDIYKIPHEELRRLERSISSSGKGGSLLSNFIEYVTGMPTIPELEVFLFPYKISENDFKHLFFSVEADLGDLGEYKSFSGFYSTGNLYIVPYAGISGGPSAVFNPVHLVRSFIPAINGVDLGKRGIKLTSPASRALYAYSYLGFDFTPHEGWEETVSKLEALWEKYPGVALPLPARYIYLEVSDSVLASLFPELRGPDIKGVKLLHISALGEKAGLEGTRVMHIPLVGPAEYYPVVGGPAQVLLNRYGREVREELEENGKTAYKVSYNLEKEYRPGIGYSVPVEGVVTFGKGKDYINIIEVVVHG